MLDQLTYDEMTNHIGTTFRLESPDGNTYDLVLAQVGKVMESQAARLKRTAFSLYFLGPREPYLPQQIYRIRHEAYAEALDLFLVPVGNDPKGILYEAVFT